MRKTGVETRYGLQRSTVEVGVPSIVHSVRRALKTKQENISLHRSGVETGMLGIVHNMSV
jgi:hypothetical protein